MIELNTSLNLFVDKYCRDFSSVKVQMSKHYTNAFTLKLVYHQKVLLLSKPFNFFIESLAKMKNIGYNHRRMLLKKTKFILKYFYLYRNSKLYTIANPAQSERVANAFSYCFFG